MRGNEYLPAPEPVARVCDQITNCPVQVIEVEFLNSPDPRLPGSLQGAGSMQGAGSGNVSYWNGDGMVGRPAVRISISEQRAYFYKGGQLAGVSLISSGRAGRETVTGNFHIIQKDKHHESSMFGE